jgi:hypothetical protein
MTRADAIDRVRKMVAQANGTDNAAEKDTASRLAAKIMVEHNLKAKDIMEADYVEAYDEIAKVVKDFTDKNPPITASGLFGSFNILGEIVSKSSEHIPSSVKVKVVKALSQAGTRKMVLVLLGEGYNPLMSSVETILKGKNIKPKRK